MGLYNLQNWSRGRLIATMTRRLLTLQRNRGLPIWRRRKKKGESSKVGEKGKTMEKELVLKSSPKLKEKAPLIIILSDD